MVQMTSPDLAALLPFAQGLPDDANEALRLRVPLDRLPEACALAAGAGYPRLMTMVGTDDRATTGGYGLHYLLHGPAGLLALEAEVPASSPVFPSVTPVLPAAHWYEREVHDLLGLRPEGHPHPERLVLHEGWPAGVHPLRKDFDPSAPVPVVADAPPPRFHHLHGDGIVEIPVGPIHAGVIEPGHFRFAAVGELVLHLEARLFYTHRGVEKLAEGRPAGAVLPLAERLCGVCAASHAVSYCQAVEAVAGVAPPPRAQALRVLVLELERLYNHVGDLGNMCAGTGFMVGSMRGGRLRDLLQQLNERLTGSRYLRNICTPGGMRRDLDAAARNDALRTLESIEQQFVPYVELLLNTESFTERMKRTGLLPKQAALDLGAVGVAARASGVNLDARRDLPYAAYPDLRLAVAAETGGDVEARFLVRFVEALTSFRLCREVLEGLPGGPLVAPLPPLPPNATGLGVTESPRGENVHWLRTDAAGRVDRWRVRSASFPNWPIVPLTVPGNMVPDFPLINKSFELCYSCLDR